MNRLRIIVGGFLGLLPAGGVTWDYVQYPVGLAALGHDVYYVEDTRLWPIYQSSSTNALDGAANAAHLATVMTAFGLGERWAYRDEASQRWFGLGETAVRDLCRTADVLLNISCSTVLTDAYRAIPARVLVDSDPMFTQIQYETAVAFTEGVPYMRELVDSHTHHFTYGENIGADDCRVPSCGISWRSTRQPICLEHWPVRPLPAEPDAPLTTVMNWSAGDPLIYNGEPWGQKDVEFRRFMDVPSQVPEAHLAVAVGQTRGDPFPAGLARGRGWCVLDPATCVSSCWDYRRFVYASAGEFSVAKETYVKARTGWFSGRSACYLAAARPVVAQDTGWSRHLPHGAGLLAFTDVASAVEGLQRVRREPAMHARAARAVAEEYFRSDRVLGQLLTEVGG